MIDITVKTPEKKSHTSQNTRKRTETKKSEKLSMATNRGVKSCFTRVAAHDF